MTQPDACIVRITGPEGKTRGTGFVICGDGRIATCAHVVEEMEPHVAFPGSEQRPAQVVAIDPVHDVAILKLEGELPPGAEAARLGNSAEGHYRNFRTRGYRPLGELQGIPAEGRVVQAVSECPGGLYLPLILKSQDIRKGMSGAPVYIPDADLVVGMITGYWDSFKRQKGPKEEPLFADRDTAFATPAEAIADSSGVSLQQRQPELSRLRAAYISPVHIFERVRLDRFVGREWLDKQVDDFLEKQDRGVFVLEAGAGLGKTTFLAHLVRERGFIHHFVESTHRTGELGPAARNLAVQLVLHWDLGPHWAEEILSDKCPKTDVLENLLWEAARKRDETRPGTKIVLVVDALDEASVVPGENVLGLPHGLPSGVYLIVSQRPVPIPLQIDGPRVVFCLEAEENTNLDDMRAFLERAAAQEGITRALAESAYTSEQFVAALLEKCQGVWIYLHYVVEEIEAGRRSPLDLEALPKDLWQYYSQYWATWRDQDAEPWYDRLLPLLSTLAVAREPLTFPCLCGLAGIAARPRLERLLQDDWRPFLTRGASGGAGRYRLYHGSLREFLTGQCDLSQLRTTERDFAEEMAEAAQAAHKRIVDRYIAAWGGWNAALSGLMSPSVRDVDDGYGVRYLTVHLTAGEDWSSLHRLLGLTLRLNGHPVNVWAEAQFRVHGSYSHYLWDVLTAWDYATGSGDIGDQVRCALLHSTVVSLIQAVRGEGGPRARLSEALLLQDPSERVSCFIDLMSSSDPVVREEAKAAAVRMVMDVKAHESLRSSILQRFAPFFSGQELLQMCDAAYSLSHILNRAPAICALVAHMPQSTRRQEMLQHLMAEFGTQSTTFLNKITSGVSSTTWPMHPTIRYDHPLAVTKSIPWIQLLPDDEQHAVFESAMSRLAEISESIGQALGANNWDFPPIVSIAASWTPHMPGDLAEALQVKALEALAPSQDDDSLANGLLTLAPHLVPSLFPIVQQTAQNIQSKWIRAEVLLFFADLLDRQQVRRLQRIINNPLRMLAEWLRWFRCYTITGKPGIIDAISLFFGVLFVPPLVMKTWLGAQLTGGLRWKVAGSGPGSSAAFGSPETLSAGDASEHLKEQSPMPSSSIDDLAGRLLTLCSLGVFPNAAFPGEGPTTRWKWPGFAYWLPARVLWTCQRAVMIRYLHAWPSQRNFLWSLLGDLLGMNSERVVSSYYPHHIALAERLYDLGVPGVWGTQKPWGLYTRSLEHLISILPSLEWDELESKVPDLLNILRDLDDDFDPCRAKALVALSRTQAVRAGNILIDMLAIATQIGPWQFRAFALSALVPYLVELPNEEASPALSEGLRSLARRGRESFIADLRFLVPWIRKLGGTSVIEEAAQALQDVGCWWP